MLTALCVLAALTGGGPLFDLSALTISVATYENQYYQILRLRSESQALPETERAEKARTLGDKVLQAYASLEYLSFKQETIDFWCTEGSWRSYLPMEYWPQEPVATGSVAMTAENLHVEISAADGKVYSMFLADVKFAEYRWPLKGEPGEYTEYLCDPRYFRLCRGVDPHVRCVMGALRYPWVGDKTETSWYKYLQTRGRARPGRAEGWRQMLSEGSWIGVAREGGELCDVVLLERDDIDRWDVFFINPKGRVVLRYVIVRETDNHRNKWVVPERYREFRTDPLPPSEFAPSEALLREARNWRKLTEAEAMEELRKENGQDIQP